METNRNHSAELELSASLPVITPTWDRKIARVISNFANPIILSVISAFLVASTLDTSSAWRWAAFQIAVTIVAPALFILWLLRTHRVTDFDIFIRSQRLRPYLFTIGSSALSLVIMAFAHAPSLFLVLTGAGLTQVMIMFVINLEWKISAHAAGMAGFTTLLWFLLGTASLPFFVGIPLMIWSRVRLHRHTLTQTLAGTLLGVMIFAAYLELIY